MIIDLFAFERTIELLKDRGWEVADRGRRKFAWVHLVRGCHAVHLSWSRNGAFGNVGRQRDHERGGTARQSQVFQGEDPDDTVDQIEIALDRFESLCMRDRASLSTAPVCDDEDPPPRYTFTFSDNADDFAPLNLHVQYTVPLVSQEITLRWDTNTSA